ncbi:hypothetical protein PR048_021828, partial [Dryococelus australis]
MALSSKKKCTVLTVETKLKILARLGKGESGIYLAKIYGVGTSTIRDVKPKRVQVKQFAPKLDCEDGTLRRKTAPSAKNKALEDAMYVWFTQRRSLGEPISGPMNCEKALQFNEQVNGQNDFKAKNSIEENENEDCIVNEVTKICSTIPGFEQCDKNDASEWLGVDGNNPGYQVLSDQEIADMVSEETIESDGDKNENDIKEAGPHIPKHLWQQTLMSWLEKLTESTPTQLTLLKRIKDLAAKKQTTTTVQKSIKDFLKAQIPMIY